MFWRKRKTHDYSRRCWGHDYTFDPIDNGLRGAMMGWGHGLKQGDYLILENKDKSTRYQIEKIDYFSDPNDMWSADVVFASR